LGKDGNAETVLRGIKEEGVETSLIISKTHLTTAMTYIIADEETNSRTCIHSPVEVRWQTLADISLTIALVSA